MARTYGFGNLVLKRYIFAYGSTALHQDGRVVKALDLRSNGRIVRVGSNPTPGNVLFAIIFQPKRESLIETFQIFSRNFGFKVELFQNIGTFLFSYDAQTNVFYDVFHLDIQERAANLMQRDFEVVRVYIRYTFMS